MLMSHESGSPFSLQSPSTPLAMSHESSIPLLLQSTIVPSLQMPLTQNSTPLHGSPSSQSESLPHPPPTIS